MFEPRQFLIWSFIIIVIIIIVQIAFICRPTSAAAPLTHQTFILFSTALCDFFLRNK